MATETERKFLIREDKEISFTQSLANLYPSIDHLIEDVVENGTYMKQGYLPPEIGIGLARGLNMQPDFRIAEARLRDDGGVYTFTIKGDGSLSRPEIPREITPELFASFWPSTQGHRVEKIRLKKPFGNGLYAEIDVYTDGRDLIVAEVEGDPEVLMDLLPLGEDVTEDKSYKNKNLAK